MKNIYSSIDIGTDAIKVVVAELYQNKLNLLAATSVKSQGIKKGLIYDVELAKSALQKAFYEIEEMLGFKIKQVICTIPSYYANFTLVTSSLAIDATIDNEPGEIEGSDISAILKRASYTRKNPDEEVVATLPIDFKIDNKVVVKSPPGIPASKLDVRAISVTVPKKNIYSVVNLIESMNITVKDVSITGIGDMYAFKNKEFDKKIGAIIDIGSETTTVSLYNKGVTVKTSILGLGGKNIDNDLCYIYKLNSNVATNVKEKFALAHKRFAKAGEIYEVANNEKETIKISQVEASEVVMARLTEIMKLAKKEIRSLTNREIDYILVTGGTTNMTNFNSILTETLGRSATIGNMKLIGVRNNAFSVCVGNIVYYISKLKLLGIRDTMVNEDDIYYMTSATGGINGTSNETMLGKVFGYFFNE